MNILLEAFKQSFDLVLMLDRDLFEILLLSLKVSLVSLLFSCLIGLPLGTFLAIKNFWFRDNILIIFNTLMGLPPVVVGLIVYLIISRSGPLGWLGILYTPTAMIIAQMILIIPIIVSLSAQAIEEVHQEYKYLFLSLVVPSHKAIKAYIFDARYSILTVMLAGFGRAISEVGAVIIVGGNIDHLTRVMTTSIALETSKGNLSLALALGIILLSIALSVNFLLIRLLNRATEKAMESNTGSVAEISPIKIKDLSISLNDRFILRNINCQINDKSITAILGPNGAGKSLLLQTINGLIPVLKGKITYNLNQLDNDIRKQQAMVFQSPTLLRRTVLGNMEFVNSINKNSNINSWRIVLKKVGLEAYNDKPARLLSGGEKQRLSLARALLIQPKLLLLDEPTANLDPYSLKLIEDLILEENSKGTTIILTTHDMSQAKRLASDIIFINKGEILEQTQAKIFFKEPQTIEAKKYLTGEILL